MKKLSFSLFAVLAIVLAMTSAFTKNTHKFATTYKVWGLPNVTYLKTAGVTVTQAEAGTLIQDNGSVDQSIATTFNQTIKTDGCSPDATYLCAAEVKRLDNGNKSISETADGDFFTN
jgi:hypothetical protein